MGLRRDEDKVKDVNEKMNIIPKNRTKSAEESSDEAMRVTGLEISFQGRSWRLFETGT